MTDVATEPHDAQPMYEWLAVALSGALGGFLSTFLPAGLDTRFPRLMASLLDSASRQVAAHIARNTVFGAAGAFIIWGGFGNARSFTADDVTVNEVAVALLIGLGGVATVNSLVREQSRSQLYRRAVEGLSNVAATSEDEDDERNQ